MTLFIVRHYSLLFSFFFPSELAGVKGSNVEYFLTPSNWNLFFFLENKKKEKDAAEAVKGRSAICQCLCLVSLDQSEEEWKRDEKTVWDLNRFHRLPCASEEEEEPTENNKQTTKWSCWPQHTSRLSSACKKKKKRRQITQRGHSNTAALLALPPPPPPPPPPRSQHANK